MNELVKRKTHNKFEKYGIILLFHISIAMKGLRLVVRINSSMVIHGSQDKRMIDGNNNRLHIFSGELLLMQHTIHLNHFLYYGDFKNDYDE